MMARYNRRRQNMVGRMLMAIYSARERIPTNWQDGYMTTTASRKCRIMRIYRQRGVTSRWSPINSRIIA